MLRYTQPRVKGKVAPQANDAPIAGALALRVAKLSRIHKGKTPVRIHFIVEWAHHRRFRQRDIVRQLGVDKATVSRWFDGSLPSEKYLLPLAEYLGADEPVSLFQHPDDDWIARLMRRGTEQQRARVVRALQVLLGEEAA